MTTFGGAKGRTIAVLMCIVLFCLWNVGIHVAAVLQAITLAWVHAVLFSAIYVVFLVLPLIVWGVLEGWICETGRRTQRLPQTDLVVLALTAVACLYTVGVMKLVHLPLQTGLPHLQALLHSARGVSLASNVLFEEISCRALLLVRLSLSSNAVIGTCLAAILFAAFHVPAWRSLGFGWHFICLRSGLNIFYGVLLGAITLRSGSIVYPTLLHFVNDAFLSVV